MGRDDGRGRLTDEEDNADREESRGVVIVTDGDHQQGAGDDPRAEQHERIGEKPADRPISGPGPAPCALRGHGQPQRGHHFGR